MNKINATGLLLTGMALMGMTSSYAGQRAFAHGFQTDESASFIVDIYSAKVHLMLAGMNFDNSDAAIQHIEHVNMIINKDMLAEIAERNERIAEDIPAALDELASMVENGEDRSVTVGQIKDINNLFAEAIGVRIDPEQIEDTKVKALIVAGFASEALAAYEKALGVASTDMSSMDHDSHIAAKAFAILAKNTFYREHLAADGNTDAVAAKNGLVELRDGIYGKKPIEDVTVATHINTHPNLQKAFGLELAEDHMEEEEHEEGSMEDDHMEG